VIADWDAFDTAVREHLSAGFSVIQIPPGGFRARHPYRMRSFLGAEYGTEAFRELLKDYLRQVTAHLKKAKFKARFFFYPWDEPSPAEYAEFKKLVKIFKDAAPDVEVWCAAGGVPNPDVTGVVDAWTLNMRRYNTLFYRQAIEAERSRGVHIACYANDRYNLTLPLLHMRLLGLIMAYQKFEGMLWWEVCAWWKNPWQDPKRGRFADAGLGCMLYPDIRSETLHPSLRWFAMLEAADDAALWRTLEEAIVREAEKLSAKKLARNALVYYFRAMLSGTLAGQFRNDPALYGRLRREAFARLAAFGKPPLALTRLRRTDSGFELLIAAEDGCRVDCDGAPLERKEGLYRASVGPGLHKITITRGSATRTISRFVVAPY